MNHRAELRRGALHRRIWRWHFYAGLFVLPFMLVLALSGTVYLFKPQIERWEERAFRELPTSPAASPEAQVDAAVESYPGSQFHSYRIPRDAGDAAVVHLALPQQGGMHDVFVSPGGEVVGSFDAGLRIVEIARRVHGQLLLGSRGSWLVELAACWAIVMVLTGIFLWWPRGRGVAGVLWPRRKSVLRDLHAVTGFWASAFALVLLLTGLPWTDVWGNAFRMVREEFGWVKGTQQWSTAGAGTSVSAATSQAHASHDHGAMHPEHAAHGDRSVLDRIVAQGQREQIAFPAVVLAPGAVLFGPPSSDWTLTSLVQDRPRGITLTFDAHTGELTSRETFADRHAIDRAIGYGLAWHEGALFGVINQIIGVLTALALVTMSVTAFLMWRRRRPAGCLGAPPAPRERYRSVTVAVAVLALAALLPLLAASLLLLWLIDLLLPRLHPRAAAWLGMDARG